MKLIPCQCLKGGKTRTILLPASVYDQLDAMRGADDDPVFRSLQGGHLDPAQVHRIVKAAARRAELPEAISAHWLRHAHASHSLGSGALTATTLAAPQLTLRAPKYAIPQ